MNKLQLATKIWESANKMRSKAEANEYKEYIPGFIFYKYLSDKELEFIKNNGFTPNDSKALSGGDAETVKYIRESIGYEFLISMLAVNAGNRRATPSLA